MIVFLIGFMGCGKSYIGRHVAELIGMDYLDMDLEIETRTGKSINQIFEDIGEEGFRTLETKFITSLQANQNIIISTGGGAPCFGNNMELINKKGISNSKIKELLDNNIENEFKEIEKVIEKLKDKPLDKIITALMRKGFEYKSIKSVLDRRKEC